MNGQAVSRMMRRFLVLAVGAILSVSSLHAQVDTGSISGTISDLTGAVVSGAKVTLTNEGTGASLSTTAGADGGYDLSPVRIGSYKLEVSSTGFKTDAQIHVVVDVSARVLINFKLQPGAVSETV